MKTVLNQPNGANFLLADLHLHTPDDPQFTCPSGTDIESDHGKAEFATAYIRAAKDKGLSILAVTEHNSVEWIDLIRNAASGSGITVFPGFEIGTTSGSDGVHLLCVFEPDRPKDELDDLLTQMRLPRGNRFHDDNTPKLCGKPVDDAINFVQDNGGITIAAHVLSENGILRKESMRGEVRVNAWKNKKLFAAEIPNARSSYDDKDTFAARVIRNDMDLYKRERSIACIYSSDARNLDDIGRHATWIKLSSLTIEGLKQAFLDWEARIRHPKELIKSDYSQIVAVEWVGGFLDGLKIHFNKNLNALIGGKGTGKSTILETLRYALGHEPMGEEPRRQYEAILKEVFRPGSTVRILVEVTALGPSRYLIERSFPYDPVVFLWDDDLLESTEELSGVSPVDIIGKIEVYGQKEILELSRKEDIQVKLLKRFLDPHEQTSLDEREKECLRKLSENAQTLIKMERDKETIEERNRQLTSLREKLRQYESAGIKDQLSEQRSYVHEENLFQRIDELLRNLETRLETFTEASNISSEFLSDRYLKELPHIDIFKELGKELNDLDQSVKTAVLSISRAIKNARLKLSDSKKKWEPDNIAQRKRYQDTLLNLQTESFDPNDYIEVERKIGRLTPLIKEGKRIDTRHRELIGRRIQLLHELQAVRQEGYQVLKKVADSINSKLLGILRVELAYEGQKEEFAKQLADLKSGARNDQIQRIIKHPEFTPSRFVQEIRKGIEYVEESFGITNAAAQALWRACTQEVVYDLETFAIPPSISIQLNIGTSRSPQYKETKHLSIGQKCTAILMLILLRTPYPLIVDQPEDDLDNSFVYSDVVKSLRREKEYRQFIIATHNANIPVLGDAELIQVLCADEGKLILEKCIRGSIDDSQIREPVETILEGGHDAFEFRKSKYGF
jgi:energy-coupling factor transporter ATP-binding protein EcfA2